MVDYEKLYKETLAKAREIHRNEDEKRSDMEWLFPELKESEDEKIRKALLNHLTKMWGNSQDDVCGIHVEDAITWLEKQGNNTPTIIWHNIDEKPEELKELFCEWESDDATWHDVAFYDEKSHFFRHAKRPINVTKWVYVDELLERQGEQKVPINDFKAKNWYVSEVDGKIHDMTYNPADKVEPKFHESDWILYSGDGYEGVRHITKINENGYYIERNGLPHGIIPFNHECCMRLWTIQDAKDGDVLVDSYGNVCIYQEPSTNLMYHSRCYANNKGFYDLGGSHAISNTYPATKEQRDLLFQKMKEAGYEWNAEKKELKIVDWSKHIKYEPNSPSIIEPKQEWSEEDEEYLRRAITATKEVYPVTANWLKSLKNRVQPQPKEWSDEDEEMAEDLIKGCVSAESPYQLTHTCKEITDWLKSIKDRIKGKED